MVLGDKMANEYILLKNDDNDIGQIALTKHAFELIARYTIEDEGTAVLDHQTLKRAMQCHIADNRLYLSLNIRIKYGQNVNALTERLQTKIAKNITQMTNYKGSKIDINVVGFIFST